MTYLINTIYHHKIFGLVLSVFHFIIGRTLPFLAVLLHLHLPPIILETLQALAFIVGIGAGSVTIYSFVDKKLKEDKIKQKNKSKQ